jgi:hypothetical protein
MSGLGCTPTFDLLLSVLLLLRDADVLLRSRFLLLQWRNAALCMVAAVRYIPADQTCAYHRHASVRGLRVTVRKSVSYAYSAET